MAPNSPYFKGLVAGVGFEPTTFRVDEYYIYQILTAGLFCGQLTPHFVKVLVQVGGLHVFLQRS
ncbi:MAG: hypothetical protein ACPGNR_13110, partial [Paracoccaceae bacterium]